ncbi:TBP-binding domain containing protein, partial [Asbolus verrucosus]
MSDSDEENYNNKDEDCVDLTGFLFGNINEQGQLESDVLDTESQKQLSNLGKLGLGSTLKEMIGVDNISREDSDSDYDSQDTERLKFDDNRETSNTNSQSHDETSYESKSPTAIDFSDINELAEEEEELKQENYDADDEHPKENDNELMPPPPVPTSKESTEPTLNADDGDKKKLETPLAAMLPSKYANINVTDLFPDFRHGKVLRFSRLFGPGKPSSLPNIWRNVRKKRKRRKHKDSGNQHDSDSNSEDEKPKHRGWFFDYAETPPLEQCKNDDEEKFLKPIENTTVDNKTETQSKDDTGPKVADWRFGPAQIWYDMLEVPETGDGFNYGFKVKDEKQPETKKEPDGPKEGDEFPDDAFLMVTQLHWEDDVVWDGSSVRLPIPAPPLPGMKAKAQ